MLRIADSLTSRDNKTTEWTTVTADAMYDKREATSVEEGIVLIMHTSGSSDTQHEGG